MGQLERYGLYVLVLVIFLILGVAIWGEPSEEAQAGAKESLLTKQLVMGGMPAETDRGRNRSILSNIQAQVQSGQDPAPRPQEQPNPVVSETPPATTVTVHEVKKGETLGEIALRYLGGASKWKVIQDANPGIDPNNLKVGTKLTIPARASSGGSARAPAAESPFDRPAVYKGKSYMGFAYRVEPNDSMAKISKARFGSEAYTHIIQGINPGIDPARLSVGTVIRIPTRDELRR